MDGVKVPIFVESRYQVNRKRIKTTVVNLLKKNNINGDVEVSIAIVGDRKMRDLSRKYKGEDKTRSILSFSMTEGKSSYLPEDFLMLGDIILSYPQVILESSEDEMLVDDKIDELVEHGVLHLLGINHE